MNNNLLKCDFKCCGCGVCEEICPKNAIKLKENSEGFLEFSIDNDKCVNCGLCIKKCPQLKENMKRDFESKYYAAYLKDDEKLKKSTSGGIFQGIVEKFIEIKDFAIVGCIFDENLVAKHTCIENKNDIYKLYGSKYVQSDTRKIYSTTKSKLDEGKKVIFSGTPCQIQGLYSYLGEQKYDNLYTIDLICHGVPSPLLFKKYKEWIEKKKKGKISEYKFRSKDKNSWELLSSYEIKRKKYYENESMNPYYNSFIKGDTYRESCYDCKYACKERTGDITLGDFWGIEDEHPLFNNDLGVSLIIVNSIKGKELIDLILNDIEYVESTFEKASKKNHNLIAPTNRKEIRNTIYDNIGIYDFEQICKKNIKYKFSVLNYIKSKIPIKLKKYIKKIIKRRG